MATTTASKILLAGGDVKDRSHVVTTLYALSNTPVTWQDNGMETPLELLLTTKYYEADVALHVHEVIGDAVSPVLAFELAEYEALLFILDVSDAKEVQRAQQLLEHWSQEAGFNVGLVLGTRTEGCASTLQQEMDVWCLDNGLEYVPMPVSTARDNQTDANAEKQGMERVLEALHCNMWQSMRMVDCRKRASVAVAEPQEANDNQIEDEASETKTTTPSPEILKQPTPEPEQQHDQEPSPARPTQGCVLPLPTSTPVESKEKPAQDRLEASLAALSLGTDPNDDEDDDTDMADFNNLIAQVRRVREQGKSLSDQERREQAERVAMQLWRMIGSDDEHDDEAL